MAHQARLRNSIYLLVIIVFFGCKGEPAKTIVFSEPSQLANFELEMNNGLLTQSHMPFTGRLINLFSGTKDTAEVSSYVNGREDGEWKKFYSNHQIKEIRYFKNGKKTGSYKTWWENGKKQLEYNFVADEYEGSCKEFNEKGVLMRIMNYKKGQEEGEQKWWYDGGKIKANYIIKDGRRYGLLGTKNCINVTDSIFKN